MAKVSRNGNGAVLPAMTTNQQAAVERMAVMIRNEFSMSRAALIKAQNTPQRNIDSECGYPAADGIDVAEYQHAYDRWDVATRVVNIYPEECWAMGPDVYETEDLEKTTPFELAFDELNERLDLFGVLAKADELSGIGHCGIVLLGFSDGKPLSEPVLPAAGLQLTFAIPFSEAFFVISAYDINEMSPRYGLPTEYKIDFLKSKQEVPAEMPDVTKMQDVKVHWTRIQHLADNRQSSPFLGVPRQRPVWNRILDIRKIMGGNGEGMWKGGFPGLSIETQTGSDPIEIDTESVKDEVEQYMEGMKRYLALENLTVKPLSPQVSDPKPHLEAHLSLLCISIGVPMRVFKGSEEAKMASSQDMRTWNKRLTKRQNKYLTPFVIRPTIVHLIALKILPQPDKLIVKWPDLNAPTENDRATTAQKITEALTKYVMGKVYVIMPPKEYLTIVLGYPLDQVNAVLKAAGGAEALVAKLEKMAQEEQKAKLRDSKAPGASEGAGVANARPFLNFNPNHDPDDGRFTSGAGGMAADKGGSFGGGKFKEKKLSERAARAKAAYNPSTKEKQDESERAEHKVTRLIDGVKSDDNRPMDVVVDDLHGVELKVMHDAMEGRVNMRPDSRKRKEDWAKAKRGRTLHTVLIDNRDKFADGAHADKYSGHKIYYAKGVGAFRLQTMTKVNSFSELKKIIRGE